jgi:hypothetical protein
VIREQVERVVPVRHHLGQRVAAGAQDPPAGVPAAGVQHPDLGAGADAALHRQDEVPAVGADREPGEHRLARRVEDDLVLAGRGARPVEEHPLADRLRMLAAGPGAQRAVIEARAVLRPLGVRR